MTSSPAKIGDENGSSSITKKSIIHYLGPPGTYSHQVALEFAKKLQTKENLIELRPSATIYDTVEDAKRSIKKASTSPSMKEYFFALLPFENNSNGPVTDSYEILHSSTNSDSCKIKVVSEAYLPVNHSLLVTKDVWLKLKGEKDQVELSDLKKFDVISSHPQALGQCSRFLKQNMRSDVLLNSVSSTGEAAKQLTLSNKTKLTDDEKKGIINSIINFIFAATAVVSAVLSVKKWMKKSCEYKCKTQYEPQGFVESWYPAIVTACLLTAVPLFIMECYKTLISYRRNKRERKGERSCQSYKGSIASQICTQSDVYDLVELFDNIQNSDENTTRFLLCQIRDSQTEKGDMVEDMDIGTSLSSPTYKSFRAILHLTMKDIDSKLLSACLATLSETGHNRDFNIQRKFTTSIRKLDRSTIRLNASDSAKNEDSIIKSVSSNFEGVWAYTYLIEVQIDLKEGKFERVGEVDSFKAFIDDLLQIINTKKDVAQCLGYWIV